MFTIAMGAALVWGWLRGGRLTRLAEVDLKLWWAFILAFGLQFWLQTGFGLQGLPAAIPFAVHLLSYVILIYVLWANLKLPGFRWLTAGSALNGLVIILNGGRMPVNRWALEQTGQEDLIAPLASAEVLTHTLRDAGTVLPFLGDVLVTPPYFPRPTTYSVGDVLMLIGLFVCVTRLMKDPAS